MQNIACFYTNLILLLRKIPKKDKKKKKNFSLFSEEGGGCPPSLLCTAEAACTVLASLSFQCPSLHLMCTSNYGSLHSEQKL